MPPGRRVLAVVLCATVVGLAACRSETTAAPPPVPVGLSWQELTLPVPAGITGRLILSDATACDGHWYVTGGYGTADGETQPAAWESTDGVVFTPMTLQPLSFYGRLAVLYAAACRDGRLAVIGAKRGGAHGNPRVTNWYTSAPHTLRQIEAAFSLFGGPFAVNVGRLSAGRDGWLISGNRTTGAAVWNSPDARDFQITEGVPPLAAVPGLDTNGKDAVWVGDRWVLVGGVIRTGRIDRDPVAWTSPDGVTWQRQDPPSSVDYDEMQRVTAAGPVAVGVGVDGATFRSWRLVDGAWRLGGRFGSTVGHRPPFVNSVTAAGSTILATVANNDGFSAWLSADLGETWRPVTAPVPMGSANDRSMVIAGSGAAVLLIQDDAQVSRVWRAETKPTS